MKIPSLGAKLYYADGRTDRETGLTKLLVAFEILRKLLKTVKETN